MTAKLSFGCKEKVAAWDPQLEGARSGVESCQCSLGEAQR